MGALAVESLVEKIEARKVGPPGEIILKPELIIRRTCGFHLAGYRNESQGEGGMSYSKFETPSPKPETSANS
jgi:hypothetical protein